LRRPSSRSRRSLWQRLADARRPPPRDGQARVEEHRDRLLFRLEVPVGAIAEAYFHEEVRQAFVEDFVAAWNKVMDLDR